MSIAHARTSPSVAESETEIERRMAFGDAALGAAGHEVSDPELRAISRRVAAGEITGDEAAALVRTQLLGNH
ncbi:antitoxin VbhA family protein [Herbiconiux solani]|uniref:antitoxin VbhA family protein n=1 Tax=Herbiconiux solani TaxID=661329 RepID=UPI0012ED5FA9|nr:antitoxin VbhA family protein [Herbiconiux solani]